MKKKIIFALLLFAGFAFVLSGCGKSSSVKPTTAEKPTAPKLRIYDIMACDVYVDFDASYSDEKIKKEQHKFLISFAPYTKGVFVPDLIERITAYGPDGYKVDFAIKQEHNSINKNGYIYDERFGTYWYMVNLNTGFMKEGEYKIEVVLKNGDVLSKSRFQRSEPSKKLVAAYVKGRQKIYNSYSPSNGKKLKAGTPLKNIKVSWSPLSKLAGQDAYYIFRLSEGSKSRDFNTQKLVWWDNVFAQKFYGNKNAGLNRGEVVITNELKPKTGYVHFTEITDSNSMGDTNICIFQPHQVFITP